MRDLIPSLNTDIYVDCEQVGSGALLPLEMCMVLPGQIMRKQVPPEKTKAVVEFATLRPSDRLDRIHNGLNVRH